MNRKKILYIVTQGVLGGAQKYVLDLATGLKNNFDCAIASGVGEALGEAAAKANIPYHRLSYLTRDIHPLFDVLAVFEIARLVKRLKPDIVHLNSTKAMIVGSLGARLGGATTVLSTMHGLVLAEPLPLPKKLLYYLAEKLAAPFQNAWIAVSSADRAAALKYALKPAEKVFVIHNGIDFDKLDFLPREQAREEILKLLPPPARDKKILFALADHYPVKGLEVLAKAVAEIKNRNDIAVVNIGRPGPATKNLEHILQKLKLQDSFFILKSVSEPTRLLKAADIFVLPSLKEGLPYALLYAAAAELPITASAVGGIPEVVKDNASALLVPSDDADKLAQAIQRLLDDKPLANRLAGQAALGAQLFNLPTMLDKTKKLYQQLIQIST